MASSSDGHRPLREPPHLPDISLSPILFDATGPVPGPPRRRRPGYARLGSAADYGESSRTTQAEDEAPHKAGGSPDIGIGSPSNSGASSPKEARRERIRTLARVPVGRGYKSPLSTPGSAEPLVSRPAQNTSAASLSPEIHISYEGAGLSYDRTGGFRSRSDLSAQPSPDLFQYDQPNDSQRNLGRRSNAFSIKSNKSAYETDFQPQHDCRAHTSFFIGRSHWLSVTVLILAVYSTVMSGIFVVIALKGFRYGRHIRSSGGALTYSTASLLTALFAKTIELSFTTVFVAFLGQVLSRRAFMKRGKGVTLAELNMRSWILQPGTMLTHFETVQYAAFSVLGLIALVAALVAMFYTTASDALVQPQLKFGGWEPRSMQSSVISSFANVQYLEKICPMPINDDPAYSGETCLQIEHASQGYHNYEKYVAEWSRLAKSGTGATDQKSRPPGYALLNENVTVTAKWIHVIDMAATSARFGGRIINNVTLAMPHSGVHNAARDTRNDILQPEDLDGLGIYNISASVPSPVVNVLCANLDKSELAPLIYTEWPESKKRPFNTSTLADWPNSYDFKRLNDFSITTAVDEVFGWGSQYGAHAYPPAFPRFPAPFNTLLNHTFDYGRNAVYLLGMPGPNRGSNYTICQLKAALTPFCSTHYSSQGGSKGVSGGGHLEAVCEDSNDAYAYVKSVSNATSSIGAEPSLDWPWVASEAMGSLSLNAGYSDGNASNARLLTQYFLTQPELNPSLPSPAEALAVMTGCTLLMSAQDAPFVMFWNYTRTILDTPATQFFNATLRAQQYASGGVYDYQRGFHVILLLVFFTNIFMLGYFIVHRGLVTDFADPPNLFSLAVNSPPSQHLAGSCGGGPHGTQYKVSWRVNAEGDHLFMESKNEEDLRDLEGPTWKDHLRERMLKKRRRVSQEDDQIELTGGRHESEVGRMYDKFSKRRSFL